MLYLASCWLTRKCTGAVGRTHSSSESNSPLPGDFSRYASNPVNLDQYTADAVCRAMGIPRFADTRDLGNGDAAMRIVLRPSFTPEVCLTFTDCTATVSTLYEMLWHQPVPCTLPSVKQSFPVIAERQASFAQLLRHAVHEIRNDDRMVIICDGMSFDVVWYNDGSIDQVSTHVIGQHVEHFISAIIQFAFTAANDDLIRNNLANCGRYVDLDLPVEKTMFETSKKMNIGVFGTPDDRDDLIRRISPHKDA